MANFSIIALKVLQGNSPNIQKILKEDWYLFNQSYKVEKDVLKKNKNYPLKDDFFSMNISISAIVGKNGSGKDSILEIVYRMINNFSFILLKEQQKNGAFIEDIYADLYFVIDNELVTLHCRGNFVGFKNKADEYGFDLCNDKNSIPPEFKSYKIVNGITKKESIEIAKTFFYTIVTNYSLQAFLDTDYSDERSRRFDKKTGEYKYDPAASWINNLFHKNDGYMTPIVLNPYREKDDEKKEQILKLSTEQHLTKQRITEILIESKNSNKQFIDDYQLNSIDYRYDPEKILRKFPDYESPNNLRSDFIKAWNHVDNPETYTSIILKGFGYEDTTLSDNAQDYITDAYIYLVYKTLHIASIYPSYDQYRKLAKEGDFKTEVKDGEKETLESLVKAILKDKSHITLRISQTLNFIEKYDLQKLKEFKNKEFDFTYENYISTFKSKKNIKRAI
ncbi:hypothetical protein Barb4_03308 [Bacteroidales bacterium Barb4]|nr:hypothetical protein Barb4_03308 [Bacteroidales bacterium Barb4]